LSKVVRSLREHQLPKQITRADWKEAALAAFSPYFRRRSQLNRNIDSFLIELRNLARILQHQDHLAMLSWCLGLHRRVLRSDRAGTLAAMIELLPNMQKSDDAWLNMFETSAPLEPDTPTQDRVFQIFQTIDGVAEGCFKPQLQILYAFAIRDCTGVWPSNVGKLDFGALVANFPPSLSCQAPQLLRDPDVGIGVNQWRNIAAHRTFALVGPRTIEMRYGKGTPHTCRLGIHRLRTAWHWLLRTHSAVRLANTITFVEHMPDLHKLGLPKLQQRMSATLVHVSHGLSSVGFETVNWTAKLSEGVLTLRDRLGREPKRALIHASQQLILLGVGVRSDVAMRDRIKSVAISLVKLDGTVLGVAKVSPHDAEAFSKHNLTLKQYLDRVYFSIAP
jgi:hypothetical protein